MASIDFATTVLLINGNEAEPAFRLSHNNSFRICDDETSDEHNPSRDREGTPFIRLRKMWLVLTTTRKPFDPLFGWIFGSDDEICDLVLDEDSTHGVSGKHFRIDHHWESKSLILTNISRHGTKLSSPSIGLRGKTISGSGTWRIRPDEQTTIEAGKSSITIEVPRRGVYQNEYDDNLEAYYREVQEAVPQVRRLRFHGSLIETPLVARGEQTRSQYVLQEEIGKGAYGTVFKAFDPSTNRVYAAKKISYQYSPAEINILRRVSHDHIVAFVDILVGPDTILVLEYMAGGNFLQLASLTEDEVTITLKQQLLAVSYLHCMGITHRDIKPANILIQQRRPDLITKLSDFGLSSETARLVTFCGTEIYCAPEIEESYRRKMKPQGTNASYTNAVDVWSLGIFGMEYTIGLPRQPKPWRHSRWTQRIISRVSDHQGQLGSLLTEMLQSDPKRRPSADECLLKYPLQGPSPKSVAQASKRRRCHLSTIREDLLAKIPSSDQERKRARLEQSESDIQPEHQILDLFGSQWLRNSLCVGSHLAAQAQEDEAELDLSESKSHSGRTDVSGDGRMTIETIELSRGVGGERDLGEWVPEDSWDRERQEIVRQLLCSIQEEADEGVDKSLPKKTTSDSTQFRFSGFR